MIWTPPERQEAAASKEGTGPIPQIFTIQKLPSASTCTSAQVQYWKTVLGCIPQMLKDLPLILQGKNSALTFRSKQCHYYHYNQPVHCKIESKRGGEITCMQLHPQLMPWLGLKNYPGLTPLPYAHWRRESERLQMVRFGKGAGEGG